MTIFGIIWVVLIVIFMFKDIKYLFVLTILSSIFQCNNVIAIQNVGIGPQIITSIALIIKVFILRKFDFKVKINKKMLALNISLVLLLVVAFLSLVLNNNLQIVCLRYIQLISYFLCFIAMSKIGEYIEEEFVYKLIRYTTIFLVSEGFLQILITSGIFPRLKIINILFYNDTISNVIYFTRNHYFRILSTYMEPSYYAGFIVGAFYYFIIKKDKIKQNKILIWLILLQIILTFSSTAYITFTVLGLIYLIRERSIKNKIFTIIIAILIGTVMYIGFYNVLDDVIFSKAQSGSANARFAWNEKAIRMFNENKIIGNGYKTVRASSVVYTILAEMGVIGLISYCLVNFIIIKDIFFKKEISTQELGIRFAICGVCISQVIAVPDIDICTYWMWMNLLAVLMSRRRKEEYERIK